MDAGNFTEDEKRFVLAEYIKASQVDTEQLVGFIKMHRLQTDWFSMQLPGGRNMHQCMRAASSMLDIQLDLPSLPNLKKRKSASDLLTEQQAPKRMASMTHIPYQHRPSSRAQDQTAQILPQPSPQAPHQQPGLMPRTVNIQPRPAPDAKQPTAEGYGVFQSKNPSNGYNVFQSNPTGRKRGRPSKAEKEAQARANSSSLAPAGPIPISPKPTAHPPAPPLPGPGAHYPLPTQSYVPPTTNADPRDARGGSGNVTPLPRVVPPSYPEAPVNTLNSEKSPSIGNLVTADSPPKQHRTTPAPIVVPHIRDPPVTSSA
ncbi:hypothetical protein BD289DRAFT_481763 [Coniella lustricola]|uniref:Uncharacterized protein n=1 Tax=Coniella lustricola TaxID=2025994 RepID=A0A2T3ABD7_9PEZI|nr:hypothetical protein BD289DRAFT_481763 [Coniella lustricola]